MIVVCFVLLALVAAGTGLEYMKKRQEGLAKKHQEEAAAAAGNGNGNNGGGGGGGAPQVRHKH